MTFNSFLFVGFFVLVYTAYLTTQARPRLQNAILLVASLTFYGYWDWRFLSLLLFTCGVDFIAAKKIHASEDPIVRKRWMIFSIISDLSVLGFFKYFNFFTDNAIELLRAAGLEPDSITLRVVLPVGISFYTFQAMSYTIDVYRRQTRPAQHFHDFVLFVSFFPQLVAGPIERSSHLLTQILSPRTVSRHQVNAGLYLILWGYFKKTVIADNTALLANRIFNEYTQYHGLDLLIGMLAFTVQIYCDFSAYSDIARGLAKLMGFDLMLNFRLPYFALSPSDFWLRWHVSLSSWLRDYLYIPLGGNRGGPVGTYRNLCLTMLLGGLWHGAAWNFVFWGAYHGLILVAYRLVDRSDPDADLPAWKLLLKMSAMFGLTVVGWVLFRSSSVHQIGYMLGNVGPGMSGETIGLAYRLVFFSLPLVFMEVWQYLRRDLLVATRLPLPIRVPVYAGLLLMVCIFGVRDSVEFIYFQF